MTIDQFEPKNVSEVFEDEFDEIPPLTTRDRDTCVSEEELAIRHYKLFEKVFGKWYGTPVEPKHKPTPREKVESRFWPKVEIRGADECWRWIGAQLPSGYGRFSFKGNSDYAHRISFYLSKGRFPVRDVIHICHKPNCVNPRHLIERVPNL